MKWLLPIFASQVALIYPLADLTIVYTTYPEISGHPIKLHLVKQLRRIQCWHARLKIFKGLFLKI